MWTLQCVPITLKTNSIVGFICLKEEYTRKIQLVLFTGNVTLLDRIHLFLKDLNLS